MKQKKQGLGPLQLTMLALGSVIGGSFFLGSAVAVKATGPSVLLAYAFGGILVYFILTALSEMTVANPDSGSFRAFATQAFGTGIGFVVGWVYWTGMVLAMSSEATAVSILLRSWYPNLSIVLLGSLVIICVTLLNLLGAKQLTKLESGLALIKIFAIVAFIVLGFALIVGVFTDRSPIGMGVVTQEPFMAGGFKSLAGSMLIIMFTYAGFEIIGLASSEAYNLKETIPKAIFYTVIGLVGLYMISNIILLPLIPTADLSEEVSPLVAALNRHGIGWAGAAINVVLITAILSTKLAVMFGIGRTISSLANDGLAPDWLKNKSDVPRRGILFSGLIMLISLWFGTLFPNVYLFLISSAGFAILFSYAFIMITHIHFRKNGCSTDRSCQIHRFPFASLFTLFALLAAIISMPFVKGQSSGLIAGIVIVVFYTLSYQFVRLYRQFRIKMLQKAYMNRKLLAESSKEMTPSNMDKKKK